jgi:hypothetical protein
MTKKKSRGAPENVEASDSFNSSKQLSIPPVEDGMMEDSLPVGAEVPDVDSAACGGSSPDRDAMSALGKVRVRW